MARTRIDLVVDDRTDGMSRDALACRATNHAWLLVPQNAKRREELLTHGQVEWVRTCSGGCGGRWTQVFNAYTWDVVVDHREYTDPTYKVPKGTGRLPKKEARKAYFAREHPRLVKAT